MLETQERKLFLDALQPPTGYGLDYIIGTTYSLDLLALMTVPLSFTMMDWQDHEGQPHLNPLALLEAMRRYSNKMTLFCQCGMIKVPKRHRSIFAYSEGSIVEVKAPSEHGVFHPKVWIGRYITEGGPVRYKVLVQSRNLTFDRSWDMMLMLDGEVMNRKNAFSKNHPLGDFINTLPELAIHELSQERHEKIEAIANEIRRVHFEIPAPFDQEVWKFWPLGISGYRKWPFAERHDRTLVVSPFVSGSFLKKIGEKGKNHILVTRTEELVKISPNYLTAFDKKYVLQETTLPNPDEGEIPPDEERETIIELPISTPENEGLHAKMYIADQGWDASMWLGSANATIHAFEKNVEFLVELHGKKGKCGIDAFLGNPDTKGSFIQLLQEYPNEPYEVDEEMLEKEKLEKILETLRIQISSEAFKASAEEIEDHMFLLQLHIPPLLWCEDVKIKCWPLSMKEQFAEASLTGNNVKQTIAFGPIETLSVTSFFVFSLSIPYTKGELSVRFLCNFPLENAPEDRKEKILHSMLKNKEQLLRYLMLLLSDGGLNISDMDTLLNMERGEHLSKGGTAEISFPLFEMMMKALARNPEQLDPINELIEGLKKTKEGRALLPNDFDSIWDPIWTVRKGMKS